MSEINALNNDLQEITLVKDTGNSGNFFAEGYQPPLPRRPGHQTAMGMSGSNPGSGGGKSNPGEGGSCPATPTPEVVHGVFNQGPKTKQQNLNDSIEEENKLNANRKGKTKVTVTIKDGSQRMINFEISSFMLPI